MSCTEEMRTPAPANREKGFVLKPTGTVSKFLENLSPLAQRIVLGKTVKDQLLANNILDKNGEIRFSHPAVQNAIYDVVGDKVVEYLNKMIADAEAEKKKKCKKD